MGYLDLQNEPIKMKYCNPKEKAKKLNSQSDLLHPIKQWAETHSLL